jgi:hypothetical protein
VVWIRPADVTDGTEVTVLLAWNSRFPSGLNPSCRVLFR